MTATCDHCGDVVTPIVKRVNITMVGTTNVDFCPSCDLPVSGSYSLSDDEIANATVSEDPHNDGWLDYLGKGVTDGGSR